MKSRVKVLAIFTAGLLVGALAMFLVMARINQRQLADQYAMSVIEQASLGTELRQEEVARRIESSLPSYVLAIHQSKWLKSAPRSQSALRRVKDFYEINSLPVPEEISSILNNLPSK